MLCQSLLKKIPPLYLLEHVNCVAGAEGKCNHVSGFLFALLDYREVCKTNPALKSLKNGICHQGRGNSLQNQLKQV